MIGFILAVTGEAGDDHELWELASERMDWGHHVTMPGFMLELDSETASSVLLYLGCCCWPRIPGPCTNHTLTLDQGCVARDFMLTSTPFQQVNIYSGMRKHRADEQGGTCTMHPRVLVNQAQRHVCTILRNCSWARVRQTIPPPCCPVPI